MSNENKRARQELERLYGKESFIKKLKLREKYGEGHTYMAKNQVKKAVWYRGQQLTYHHILEKSKGGKATVENGALLSADDHQWFHMQSKERQAEMNQAFQDYKRGVNITTFRADKVLKIQQAEQITFDELGVEYETIRLEDNTEEDREFLDVTEGMSEAEIREYEEYKRQRNKRIKEKLNGARSEQVSEQVKRPHAYIDEEWQREIIKDVIDELRY